MDDFMIQSWNEIVKPNDLVYHLGDFAFRSRRPIGQIVEKLNGNIILIWGNHDKKKERYKEYFKEIHDLLNVQINGQQLVLCHYPMVTWYKKKFNSWHLFGHMHGNLPERDEKCMDVGVDCNNFKPFSFDEIKVLMDKKGNNPIIRNK